MSTRRPQHLRLHEFYDGWSSVWARHRPICMRYGAGTRLSGADVASYVMIPRLSSRPRYHALGLKQLPPAMGPRDGRGQPVLVGPPRLTEAEAIADAEAFLHWVYGEPSTHVVECAPQFSVSA
jgi:hypothetical protein